MIYLKRFLLLAIFFSSGYVSGQNESPVKSGWTLPVVHEPVFKTDTFNILNYGARPDGFTLNSTSISSAITACSDHGGGVVLIPGGLWLSGPIVLKNNVNLNIERDALLVFTTDFDQYPLIETNYEGLPAFRCQSPISGRGLSNIAITGSGILDGNGDAWRMVKKEKLTESQWKSLVSSGGIVSDDNKTWYPSAKSFKGSIAKAPGVIAPGKTAKDFQDIKDFLRPNMLSLINCKKVLLEGVTFQNSPAWCLHPLMCEDLTVRRVYAKNPWYAQNGDGIDLESSKNVLIENSTFDVGDDGICIKSGRDEEGRKRGMPTENVIVRNDVVYHAHGGFVIGSEMSGGARNIYVSDCSFIGTDVGLRFKTARGRGGVVENIHVSDINMKDIAGEAILFDMYYAARDPVPLAGENRVAPKAEIFPVSEATPKFQDFYISRITCNGAGQAIFIRGLPEMNIRNIYMDHLTLKSHKGADIIESSNISFKNVHLISDTDSPVFNVQNSSGLNIDGITYKEGAGTLFSINGEKSTSIRVSNTDTSGAKIKTKFEGGALANSIQIK